MPTSGSIDRLTIKKKDYTIAGDSDFARILGKWAKESQATSGDPNIKFTKQNEDLTGVDVQLDGADREVLRDVINSKDPVDVAYVTAKGDTYTTTAHIAATGDATQDAKITLSILPAIAAGWTARVV